MTSIFIIISITKTVHAFIFPRICSRLLKYESDILTL